MGFVPLPRAGGALSHPIASIATCKGPVKPWFDSRGLTTVVAWRMADGGSHRRFDRFQIEWSVVAAFLKNNMQDPVYFAGDFLLDCLRRFFSCAVCSVCSMGRKRQTLRLTSTNSLVRV